MQSINSLLQAITGGMYRTLSVEDKAKLPDHVADLLARQHLKMVAEVRAAAMAAAAAAGPALAAEAGGGGSGATAPPYVGMVQAATTVAVGGSAAVALQQQGPSLAGVALPISQHVGSVTLEQLLKQGLPRPKQQHVHSAPGAPIPHLQSAGLALPQQQQDRARTDALAERVRHVVEQDLAASYAALRSPAAAGLLQAAQAEWAAAASMLAPDVQRMAEVLEGFVLPPNRCTRKRAAPRGSQLYMPGLMRAVATDFNDKNIFAAKRGGPRRHYSVCVAVDSSASMLGHSADCAMATLVAMLEALHTHAGIEDFSVLTFGQSVRVVKAPEQPWDEAAKLMLLSELRFDQHMATQDAAAVDAAVALLNRGSARGAVKKLFVLTDGYGTTGLQLAGALNRASEAGVEVVGMAVGLGQTHVPSCYARWVCAALPCAVPDALEQLYNAAASASASSSAAGAAAAAQKEWAEFSALRVSGNDDVEAILRSQQRVFGDVLARLGGWVPKRCPLLLPVCRPCWQVEPGAAMQMYECNACLLSEHPCMLHPVVTVQARFVCGSSCSSTFQQKRILWDGSMALPALKLPPLPSTNPMLCTCPPALGARPHPALLPAPPPSTTHPPARPPANPPTHPPTHPPTNPCTVQATTRSCACSTAPAPTSRWTWPSSSTSRAP